MAAARDRFPISTVVRQYNCQDNCCYSWVNDSQAFTVNRGSEEYVTMIGPGLGKKSNYAWGGPLSI